ncbi:MAG: hypothetical protein KBF27_10020 [Cypionkella sp.]|nr:hypothetical protein [Cypionkella sp.]
MSLWAVGLMAQSVLWGNRAIVLSLTIAVDLWLQAEKKWSVGGETVAAHGMKMKDLCLIVIAALLVPTLAAANCSTAEMRICLHQPGKNAEAYQLPCAYTQCSSADAVFEYFRFEDGSYARMDHADQGAVMQAEFRFVAGKAPKRYDGLSLTMAEGGNGQFRFGAKGVTMFSSDACDSSCDGLDAEGFGE